MKQTHLLALAYSRLTTQRMKPHSLIAFVLIFAILHFSVFPFAEAAQISKSEFQSETAQLNEAEEIIDRAIIEEQHSFASDHSTAFTRIRARLERKMRSRLPHLTKKISKELDRASESKISEYYSSIQSKDPTGLSRIHAVEATASNRDAIKRYAQNKFEQLIPQVAEKVAKAGGTIPFLISVKKEIKIQKASLANKGKPDRKIASDQTCLLMYIGAGLLVAGFVVFSTISAGLTGLMFGLVFMGLIAFLPVVLTCET